MTTRPPNSSNPFIVLPLTKNGLRISAEIYREFEAFYDKIEHLIPSGREAALARCSLQEACNWAVEAIACRPEYTRKDFLGVDAQPQEEGQVADPLLPESVAQEQNKHGT